MNPDNLESEESKEKTGGSQAPQNEKGPVQAEAVQKKDELSQKFSPEKDGKKPVKASRKGLIIKCVAVVIVLAGLLVDGSRCTSTCRSARCRPRSCARRPSGTPSRIRGSRSAGTAH